MKNYKQININGLGTFLLKNAFNVHVSAIVDDNILNDSESFICEIKKNNLKLKIGHTKLSIPIKELSIMACNDNVIMKDKSNGNVISLRIIDKTKEEIHLIF